MVTDTVYNLEIDLVLPNPKQPRKFFDAAKLEELSASIKEHGVQQPIKVTPRGEGYMIVMGERRWRASRIAGKRTIPSLVEELSDDQVENLALIENIQRQDLTILEEAMKFRERLDSGMTKEMLARILGIKQIWRIDERLSLLNLTPEHQALVAKGQIGNSEAFEMSRVPPEKQAIVLRKILAGELGTYNKLRAFVDGLLAVEDQGVFFELQSLSDSEQRVLDQFKTMVGNIERLIRETEGQGALRKASLHTDIGVERLDLVIQALMRIRKTMLAGEGVKQAIAAQAA